MGVKTKKFTLVVNEISPNFTTEVIASGRRFWRWENFLFQVILFSTL